jgi:hypothetical protein
MIYIYKRYTPVEPLRYPPTTTVSAQTSRKQEPLYIYHGETRRIKTYIIYKWPWAPDSSEPLTSALALSALSRAFRRDSCTFMVPGTVIVLAMNWLLNKFTIEETCFEKVYWWLQNHKFFTHFHGEITGFSRTFHAEITLEFFQGHFRIFEFECENRTFHDTLAHFNCTWIEIPWPFPTPKLKNLEGKKGYTYH